MPLPTYTGKVFVPQSDLSGLILIHYHAVERCAGAYVCALHDDGVFDHGILAYRDAAEEDTVFNRALYLAAVGYEAVFDRCAESVNSRDLIAYLCIYGARLLRSNRAILAS